MIIITMVVTMMVVTVGTFLATPIYSATATLRVATAASGTVNYSDYMYADRLLNTYTQISTTKPVLDELKRRLALIDLSQIVVKTLPNTELIQINVEHKDPTMAANIANTLADILMSQSTELYTGSGKSSLDILSEQLTRLEDEVNQARKEYLDLVAQNPLDTENIQAAKQVMEVKQSIYATTLEQYEKTRLSEAIRAKSISIVEPATPANKPSKPRKILNIGLGFLVGLMGGLGLAFLIENLDSTLYTTEQIESLIKLPNLGMIPNAGTQNQFISYKGVNFYAEAFRRIRTNILRLDIDNPLGTLLITSARPKEGKSTIVLNLAFALAQAKRKVIVVDGDMRLPSQHKLFNLPNDQGLSSVLMQKTKLEDAIQESKFPGLQVLTSGPIPRYPSELLGTLKMSEVIEQLRKSFDTILIDTPAILEVTDTAVLVPQMDGVVLVVSRGISHREDVKNACKQLADHKDKAIGFIVNRADQNSNYYYREQKTIPLKKTS